MKKLFYILVLTVFLFVLIAQVDDNLSKESVSLIERIQNKSTSESYLYLNGIFASEEDTPVSVGKRLFDEYLKLDADASYEVSEYPDSKKLFLPTGEEFCKGWEEGCLEYLFSFQFDIDSLLREHSLLLARSNRFFELVEYKTLSKPTVYEMLPPYHYIAAAERIKVLRALSTYRDGDSRGALALLSLQFSKLRRAMELQDNLIGKLVFLMKLSEITDVMSLILSSTESKAKFIPGLSQSEKSFYMIAAREFGMSYHNFKSLDKHPEFFEIGGNFPGWITRILYKPNMSINAVEPIYTNLGRLAELSPSDFAKKVATASKDSPSSSKLRNYVGSSLVAFNSLGYEDYVARFNDFEVKLALFNQVHHFNLNLDKMKNPYYGDEVPKEAEGNLCFSGPLEDKRSLRCLRVKI